MKTVVSLHMKTALKNRNKNKNKNNGHYKWGEKYSELFSLNNVKPNYPITIKTWCYLQ